MPVCPAAASDSEENTTTTAEPSKQPLAGVEEPISQLVKLLSGVPSIQQLLSQAAQRTLDELDRQVKQVHPDRILNSVDMIRKLQHQNRQPEYPPGEQGTGEQSEAQKLEQRT